MTGHVSDVAVARWQPRPVRVRHRRPPPRPRRRPRRPRRRLHPRRPAAAARPHARLAGRRHRPTTRSGGSSGSSCYEGLDLAHEYAEHGRPRQPGGLGGPGRVLLRPGAGRARHLRRVRPPDPELALRLAAVRRRAGLARAAARAWPSGSTERLDGRRRAPAPTTSPPARNHRTLELYALLVLALALGSTRTTRPRPLAALAENAAADIWADGVHCECQQRLPPDRAALVRRHRSPTPGWPGSRFRRRWSERTARHVRLRPAPAAPRRHRPRPSPTATRATTARCCAARRTCSTGPTCCGRPPAVPRGPRRRPGRRASRSAATSSSAAAGATRRLRRRAVGVLDCGPLGDGGHGHYDQLSVELMAGGHPLVVDPGRFTYAEDDAGWRRVVQGHRRAQHGDRRRPRPDAVPAAGSRRGRRRRRRCCGGTTRRAWTCCAARCCSPQYDAVHTRTLAFVDDDFWVVHDRLRAPTAHDYTAHWHLSPAAEGRVRVHRRGRSDRS